MAGLAYLAPPISGFLVYLRGPDERARAHGLQSVGFGALWPLLLYLASFLTPLATQVVFAAGGAAWIALLGLTAIGRDPFLPGAGSRLLALAAEPPLEDGEGPTSEP